MACRCEYIDEIDEDLQTLFEIENVVIALVEYDDEVELNLYSMSTFIDDILIAYGNLNIKMRMLNDTSRQAIESMKTHISAERERLEEERAAAKREDFWWHFFHPFG